MQQFPSWFPIGKAQSLHAVVIRDAKRAVDQMHQSMKSQRSYVGLIKSTWLDIDLPSKNLDFTEKVMVFKSDWILGKKLKHFFPNRQ